MMTCSRSDSCRSSSPPLLTIFVWLTGSMLLLTSSSGLTTVAAPVTETARSLAAAGADVTLDCDPCIDRESYKIKAIVHGTKNDKFWTEMQKTAIQASKDMRVPLEFELYDTYTDERMARDITNAAALARDNDPTAPDVLIVTIPSREVEGAIRDALEYIPIFGMNSGYDRAESVGLLGFVAMDEYAGGKLAASQFLSEKNLTNALFINHAKENSALTSRFDGFQEALLGNATTVEVDELVVELDDDVLGNIEAALEGCPYDAVMVGGGTIFEDAARAMSINGCDLSSTLLGTFDTNLEIYHAIAVGKLSFAISQQHFLQGTISVVLASVYATTGSTIARSSGADFGVYFSGPNIVTLQNLPSDTLQTCEAESFPVCGALSGSFFDEDVVTINSSTCPCTDRSKIKIGGVLHGVTTDSFWDIVFLQAEQAADDLGIELVLDRLEPQPTDEVWHAKMANKIISLCQEGVDGIFVTIPSNDIVAAIRQCEALNVPVISINSGANIAKELGLIHHISQLEYAAGYAAGKRLIAGGMEKAICLNSESANIGTLERCQGVQAAVAESPDVTFLAMVIAERDIAAATLTRIEETVGRDGNWEGVGILNMGPDTANVIIQLKENHPKLIAGTFDLADIIYDGLDAETFLFAIDQNPFVQGYIPVWLLTIMASTKQHLANKFIESGPSFVEKSPAEALQLCTENHFEVCPRPLDIVYNDNLLDSGILTFGYVAVALSWALSLFFLAWIVKNRNLNVVQASQPDFLALICVGAIISSSTLIALSFQAGTNEDTTRASMGCTVAPFLYTIGWVLIFSSLCAKTFRMFKIRQNLAENKHKVVSFASMLKIVVFALIVDMIFVITWTIINPLVYVREVLNRDVDLETGTIRVNSIGYCSNQDEDGPGFWVFAGPLAGFHLFLMLITNILLYKVKDMKDRYQESKYIGFAMLLMMETLAVGIPIAVAVGDVSALHVVLIGIIAVHDIGVVSLLFVPKILFHDEEHPKEDSVILASLNKVSTSKFGEAINVLDEVSGPGCSNGLTERQRAQLRLVKTLLIQRNSDQLMHVPSQLYANRASNVFLLREFGGVSDPDKGESALALRNSVISTGRNDYPNGGYYTLPEFQTLPSQEQRRAVFRLLSWQHLKRWDFSIFDFEKVSGGHPLLFLGWAILGSPYSQYAMAKACGYEDVSLEDFDGYRFADSSLKLPLKKLCDYLRAVEADYREENPYHNATHAADVLQTLHSLIQMKSDVFSVTEEVFSILLAAAVHDVKHPGKNNAFQVNAKTKEALVYNDAAVLENKHAAHAFMLMLGESPDMPTDIEDERTDTLNILSHVEPSKFASIRKRVLEAVLLTDMSQHFARVNAVKGMLEDRDEGELDAQARWDVLVYMLHIADISGEAKCAPLFEFWADRVLSEFFDQGDVEAKLGLPISPMCDRSTTDRPGSQIGFIKFVIKPAFEVLVLAIPAIEERILPQIESNLKFWQEVSDRAKEPEKQPEKQPEGAKSTSGDTDNSTLPETAMKPPSPVKKKINNPMNRNPSSSETSENVWLSSVEDGTNGSMDIEG